MPNEGYNRQRLKELLFTYGHLYIPQVKSEHSILVVKYQAKKTLGIYRFRLKNSIKTGIREIGDLGCNVIGLPQNNMERRSFYEQWFARFP